MSKERIKIISLAGLLVFGLLITGRLIYNAKWLNANLVHQSEQIPGVNSVQVVGSSGQQEFDVRVGHITDLQETSALLMKLAGKMPIRYLDSRNPLLENVYSEMQFALQEGIVRGDFVQMQQLVQQLSAKAGVQTNLSMDSDYIYLTLTQGSHQLTGVLDRNAGGQFLPSEVQPADKGGNS